MPLNEREQRILEEIERQFYQEDPKLAETVAKTTLRSVGRRGRRLALVGFAVGLLVMLFSFTSSPWIAVAGFIVMAASAGWLTLNVRKGGGDGVPGRLESWLERTRQRWHRDG